MPDNFFWYDLATSDVDAARKFYCDVVGWSYQDASQGTNIYGLFQVGGAGVAGLMPYPDGMKPPFPVWTGYIAVAAQIVLIAAVTAWTSRRVVRQALDAFD